MNEGTQVLLIFHPNKKRKRKRIFIVIHTENPQQVIAFLLSLRAIRQCLPDKVPQEMLDAILEVARWSGSASNNPSWELIVIRTKETLQALAKVEGYAGHMA